MDLEAFEQTRRNAIERLLDERNEEGHWRGELSSSALSTATAITALALVDRAQGTNDHNELIDSGINWLCTTQNKDGGWGDTDKSFSNVSTTTLVWAAFAATGMADANNCREVMERCEQRLKQYINADLIDPTQLAETIAARYGKDRTFSVPILTMCALAGRLGESKSAWRMIKQLPFELAALPQGWFKSLNLRVVSYALPALIAIGQARHHHAPTRNPLTRIMRGSSKKKTLRLLERIQPSSGGFLEATPLTSFVTMSMAGSELADHPVVTKAVDFLVASAREDGSWPIDTDLATWVTTLSVNALATGGHLKEHLDENECWRICEWLLNQQYTDVHPYTDADPGGWAWTDLPGGVPDADDTSGVIIALKNLGFENDPVFAAVDDGLRWLRSLQNRDGGIPTFCRGWGKLPFDRSCADITAHYLCAMNVWPLYRNDEAVRRGNRFLHDVQHKNGAWTPLWFGNQHLEQEENPLYGTSRVLSAFDTSTQDPQRAVAWLVKSQNEDGGWGGEKGTPSTIEETALAIDAIAALKDEPIDEAISNGVNWLMDATDQGTSFDASPIGFYFAKLWYYEKLYPMIFTVSALERVAARVSKPEVVD